MGKTFVELNCLERAQTKSKGTKQHKKNGFTDFRHLCLLLFSYKAIVIAILYIDRMV
jgi:hypothetical protein